MKPGLAILPLEVWADVFLSPWFTRQELAQFANKIKNREFSNKLQKLLHGCGKHGLHFLNIFYKSNLFDKPKYQLRRKIPEYQASLAIVHPVTAIQEDYEFPVTEMPENIKDFKHLSIEYIDDEVLDFLDNIKPLLVNVQLFIGSIQSAENVRILFTHLLPMLGSIRGIYCDKNFFEILEQHFPATLKQVKELSLSANAYIAYIPPYLKWLISPLDFDVHGPRFLKMYAHPNTIFAMVNAIRKQFLSTINPSTFLVFLEFYFGEEHNRADEFQIENETTKEQLTVRNALFNVPVYYGSEHTHWYVEIMRHPIGANVKMREWVEKGAYYKKICNDIQNDEAEQAISISGWPPLTIGKTGAMNQDNDQTADENEAGPSTSAKKMKI